jgi:ATP-dependent exoDNAse (exonuclease V) beta subunit
MEWGTLVHELLEFGTRHATAGRADLERFALWLTLDNPGQRSVATQAVGVVLGVLSSEEWQQARAAGECHVEVPFALRLAGAGSGQGGSGAAVASLGFEATEWSETGPDAACRPSRPQPPVVVTGIIDLVYRTREGWRIVDHKTDQLADRAAAALLDRHANQLAAYARAWQGITGSPARTGLHVVRTGEVVWRMD